MRLAHHQQRRLLHVVRSQEPKRKEAEREMRDRVRRFFKWLWNLDAFEFFIGCVLFSIALSWFIAPDSLYVVWSNPIIAIWIVGEMFHLGIWKDRLRKPTKSERLSKEVGELKRDVERLKEQLEHKMGTIEKLVRTNAKLRQIVNAQIESGDEN